MANFQIDTAMIFAAGQGKRMRPLTDHTPKPLLEVGGKSLLEHHLVNLQLAGIRRVVINLHWLGEQISDKLGTGSEFGVQIDYSDEPILLETAGGMAKAIPKLTETGVKPFLIVNGDVWCDVNFNEVCHQANLNMKPDDLAMLVMVDNPAQHPKGDFALEGSRLTQTSQHTKLTYSGIGVYRPELVADLPLEPAPLGPLLRSAIAANKLPGWHYQGKWSDVGTPERLALLQEELAR